MRLALNIFGYPMIFLVLAYLLGEMGQQSVQHVKFANAAPYISYATFMMLATAFAWLIYNLRKVWKAFNGDGPNSCEQCSMPTKYHASGPSGPYYKCWQCGVSKAR